MQELATQNSAKMSKTWRGEQGSKYINTNMNPGILMSHIFFEENYYYLGVPEGAEQIEFVRQGGVFHV